MLVAFTPAASLALYVVGSVVAGVGFGVTFQVVMIAIAAATPPIERARTFATTYAVSYLAFSLPAVVAGLAVQVWGLRATVAGYGVTELLLVAAAVLLVARRTVPVHSAEHSGPASGAVPASSACHPMLDT